MPLWGVAEASVPCTLAAALSLARWLQEAVPPRVLEQGAACRGRARCSQRGSSEVWVGRAPITSLRPWSPMSPTFITEPAACQVPAFSQKQGSFGRRGSCDGIKQGGHGGRRGAEA